MIGRRAPTLAALLVSTALAASAMAEPVTARAVPDAVARGSAPMVAKLAPDAPVAFEISLPLRNEAALDTLLAGIVTPGSPSYRHYLTPADFTARFGPSQSDYDALVAYAKSHGLTVVATTPNRRLVALKGSASAVDQALHLTLGLFQHPTEHRLFMAPDREPTLDLTVPVLAVTGLDTFMLPVSHVVRGAALATAPHTTGSGPSGQFIGSDMRAAYYGGTKLTGAGQSVGLLELEGYNPADIANYFKTIGQPETVPVNGISVDGAKVDCTGCEDTEQTLDIDQAISMAPGLVAVNVYVGSSALPILNQMATDDTALQLSSSWGWTPNAQADEPVFKQFIAQGQSFVDATGDYGYHLKLDGVWPADDAYVTAVGGTDLVTKSPGGPWQSETGWRSSGGGPSPDGIAQPSYQTKFINAANQGSKTLRNVPDIAAEANTDNFVCSDGNCGGGEGGTSFAAPRWAGFIALANQQAAAEGKPPVGFVNVPVYQIGGSAASYKADFHDQTSGYNGKYNAIKSFDLVTGFGSMNGQAMINALAGQ
jgi:kumamolisin